jgi:hypothetical protein
MAARRITVCCALLGIAGRAGRLIGVGGVERVACPLRLIRADGRCGAPMVPRPDAYLPTRLLWFASSHLIRLPQPCAVSRDRITTHRAAMSPR